MSLPFLLKYTLVNVVAPIVASVTEISETPPTNNSNLLTVVDVMVYAREILYQTPVERVLPLPPICAVVPFHSWSTPPLVIRIATPALLFELTITTRSVTDENAAK